jgi:hypothetical protein
MPDWHQTFFFTLSDRLAMLVNTLVETYQQTFALERPF